MNLTTTRKTKKKKINYFTKVHEEAVIKYALSRDLRERTILYRDILQPVFNEMVDKIVYTYKFNSLPNIDSLKDECKIWIVTILDKFDPLKGYKAFSYFSVITKNWFIQKTKKNNSKLSRELVYEDIHSHHDTLVVESTYYEQRDQHEFLGHLKIEINKWKELNLRTNEQKVLQAIEILFEEKDNIEIFNKKAIYLYLREITGMNTKQIVNNLNKIRQRYRAFKNKWDDGDL
jgi:hypothetical protein